VFELKREPWHAAHAMASDRDGAQEEVVVVDKIPETRPEYELPCIDCGLLTGNWCDSCEKIMMDAGKRLTPLCTGCEEEKLRCHQCDGVAMATPFPWWQGKGKIFVLKG
jgi:hypothetical protein